MYIIECLLNVQFVKYTPVLKIMDFICFGHIQLSNAKN